MKIHNKLYCTGKRFVSKSPELTAKENLYSWVFAVSRNRESNRTLLNASEIKGTLLIFPSCTVFL